MKMNNGNFPNPIDQLLTEMRQHVSSLQDKVQVANSNINKGQIINEKVAMMKEYQEKIGSLNSCWRTKNRAQLVSSLQHENRQIIALEEENRQLRFALKELEEGMHLIMNDYRKVLSGFMRTGQMAETGEALNKNTFLAGVDYDKYFGIARAAETYMALSDNKIAEDQALISQLRTENETLRTLLHTGIPVPPIPADLDNKTSSSETNPETPSATATQSQKI